MQKDTKDAVHPQYGGQTAKNAFKLCDITVRIQKKKSNRREAHHIWH